MKYLLATFMFYICCAQLNGTEMSEIFRGYWYDQGAEITRYELQQSRYGETRKGLAVLIFVTEPFHSVDHVKADNPNDPQATPLLKLNHTRSFNTGIYPYSCMQSIFQPIDTKRYPHVLKTSTSVQEWCGHVFEQYNKTTDGWQRQLHSYFQSEGDTMSTLSDSWLEDELWTRLRIDPKQLPTGTITIIPGSLYHRFSHQPAQALQAKITLQVKDASHSQILLQYTSIKRSLRITFLSKFPYTIESWIEMQDDQQTTAQKTHRIFGPYWQWNHNSDTARRAELGLK